MDITLILEYGWVFLVLIALEGVLAADNALVLAVLVKHLPDEQRKKALFYGLAGAFILRFGALFVISFLVNVWQVQAIGALYLLYISINHLVKRYLVKPNEHSRKKKKKESGFWLTVAKVELADVAFAVDSILAAVALALTLPATGLPEVGGMDGGQFAIVLAGGLIGIIIMRFAATRFVILLNKRPGLETAAFLIVGWVGVKLMMFTLAHLNILVSHDFVESGLWKAIFWVVLVGIAVGGWFLSPATKENESTDEEDRSVVKEEKKLLRDH